MGFSFLVSGSSLPHSRSSELLLEKHETRKENPVLLEKRETRNEERVQPHRAWRVLHAAHEVRPLMAVVESQLSAGMKPSVVTPAGLASPADFLGSRRSKPASLLFAWNDVRQWRRCLLDAESSAQPRGFELIHAHCFSAGMAAVRNYPAVVYDVLNFVEQHPSDSELASRPASENDSAGAPSGEHSWLGRSFRVAEQFVLTRAGAVVVHSSAVKQGVLERAASEENIFQIPAPLSPALLEDLQRPHLPRATANTDVVFFAPDHSLVSGAGDAALEALLEAFARVLSEGVTASLFLPASEQDAAILFERAKALGIAACLHALPASDCARAYEFADVVISHAPVTGSESDESSSAIQALTAGCALLAADCTGNRDSLDAGRGLVWYTPGDVRDLARRIALLTANPELRHSLAQTARRDLVAHRSPDSIGRMYQRAYHHAWLRRRIGGPGTMPGGSLEPVRQAS